MSVNLPRSRISLAAALVAGAFVIAGCDRTPEPSGVGTAPAPDSPATVPAPAPDSPAGAPAPSPSVGTTIDDTAVTTRVKSALIADPEVKGLDISVETNKGEVQLSGFVDSQAQIDRALDIARRAEGVTGVQNKLAVKTPGTMGSAVDDTLITAKVKSALVKDDTVKALDISVTTNQGQVQLSGFVASDTQIARATEVARTVEGVKGVDNKMSVKK